MSKRSTKKFAKFLLERHDMAVLEDIRPWDGLIGCPVQNPEAKKCWNYFELLLPRCVKHPEPEAKVPHFAPWEGQRNTFDRFKDIFPNVTESWKKSTVSK